MADERGMIEYGRDVVTILERLNRDLAKLRELSLNGRPDAFHGIEHLVASSYRVWSAERGRRESD